MKNRIVRIVIAVLIVLLVPVVVTFLRQDELTVDIADFIVIDSLLIGAGIGYGLIASKFNKRSDRLIVGIVIALLVLVIWADLAVGIFGLPWSGS